MRHGWLTTLRADGRPRTVRVWFVEVDGHVWIATSDPSRKIDDIRRDARVTFSIEGVHEPLSATATLRSIDSAPGVLAAFRSDYGGWDAADPGGYGPRILIRLD